MAYSPTTWTTGDLVTAALMNNVETQYDEASTDLTTHTGNTTTAHGAVSAATANKIIIRDASGRAAVATPSAAGDIATKGYADLMLPLAGGTLTGQLNLPNWYGTTDLTANPAPNATPTNWYCGAVNNGAGYPTAYGHVALGLTATSNDYQYSFQIFKGSSGELYIRHAASATTWSAWAQMWNAGNDGAGSGLNADTVDTIHFQVSGGVLQYDSGSGWVSVSVQPNTWETADLKQANATDDTFYTVLDVSGQGLLTRISSVSGASNDQLAIKVTIDGTADTWDNANAIESRQFDHGSVGAEAYYFNSICNIKFDTSLKVEIKQVSGGAADLYGSVDYGLV